MSDLKPSNFEDVIAATSLFRARTLDAGMVEPYINRKHGKEPVKYLHPLLEPVLSRHLRSHHLPGAGERVAQALSGYTLRSRPIFCAPRWARKIKS